MASAEERDHPSILDLEVTVPDHVVYREFPSETVVLNLTTGRYFGLNPTAGRMVRALQEHGSARLAAVALDHEFDPPLEVIERDLGRFCRDLAQRGLLDVSAD